LTRNFFFVFFLFFFGGLDQADSFLPLVPRFASPIGCFSFIALPLPLADAFNRLARSRLSFFCVSSCPFFLTHVFFSPGPLWLGPRYFLFGLDVLPHTSLFFWARLAPLEIPDPSPPGPGPMTFFFSPRFRFVRLSNAFL